MSVLLGLLDLLFTAFVVVQVRYFFGGSALVHATTGLTYAEYARSGFFALLAVAALVLPFLLMAHWLLRPDNAAGQRLFRWLREFKSPCSLSSWRRQSNACGFILRNMG